MVKYGLNTDADYMHALTHSAVCMARMRKSGIFFGAEMCGTCSADCSDMRDVLWTAVFWL